MNDTTISFLVKKENLEETKKVIRSLDSLGFLNGTPFELWNNYQVTTSGEISDINKLNGYLSGNYNAS